MMFERLVGASSDGLDTHKCGYFQVGLAYLLTDKMDNIFPRISDFEVADPFARNCTVGTRTNDIDPDTTAQDHMDALLWLESQPDIYFDAVIFDPPFSKTQAERKYESGHVNVYTDPKYIKDCFSEIARILKPGGRVLKLGYNSTRHNPLLDLKKGWCVCFGGCRNDVIMTLWQKNQYDLSSFMDGKVSQSYIGGSGNE